MFVCRHIPTLTAIRLFVVGLIAILVFGPIPLHSDSLESGGFSPGAPRWSNKAHLMGDLSNESDCRAGGGSGEFAPGTMDDHEYGLAPPRYSTPSPVGIPAADVKPFGRAAGPQPTIGVDVHVRSRWLAGRRIDLYARGRVAASADVESTLDHPPSRLRDCLDLKK